MIKEPGGLSTMKQHNSSNAAHPKYISGNFTSFHPSIERKEFPRDVFSGGFRLFVVA
jgi:hypothetical protein